MSSRIFSRVARKLGSYSRDRSDRRRPVARLALEALEDRTYPGDLFHLGSAFVNAPVVTLPQLNNHTTAVVNEAYPTTPHFELSHATASAPSNVIVAGSSAPNQHDTNYASSAVNITSVVVGTLPGAGLAGDAVDDPFTDLVGTASSKQSPARPALLPTSFGAGIPSGSQNVNFTETARPEVSAGYGSQAAAAPYLGRNEPNGDNWSDLSYVAQHQASTAVPAGNSVSGQSSNKAVAATAGSTVPTAPSTVAAASAAGTSAPTSAPGNGGSSAPTSVRPLTAGRPQPLPIIATGSDAGSQPLVKVFDALTGNEEFEFLAYDASFRGGVRVAVGDLNRDGIPDIITAPGPGMAPEVRVFDGKTGARFSGALGGFLAYDASFRGGVFVAAGFTNGDATLDIITAPGADGGSRVKSFSGANATLLHSFNAYGADFDGGVHVATARLPGKNNDDIITAPGGDSPPLVHVLDGITGNPEPGPLGSFLAYESSYRGGVYVATGDTNNDGTPDIITGPGAGHAPEVKVFSGSNGGVLRDFQAFDANVRGGVRVAAAFIDDDPNADVVAAEGPGNEPRVRVFSGATGQQLSPPVGNFLAYDQTFHGGVFVGAGNDPGHVFFDSASYEVNENAGTGWALIIWNVTFGGDQSFGVQNTDGTATAGVDYQLPTTNYVLPAGANRSWIPFTILDDGDSPSESDQSFTLTINPPGSLSPGQPGSTTITIHENSNVPPAIPPASGCGCSGPGDLIQDAPAAQGNVPPMMTTNPIRYADGVALITGRDLSSAGFGVPWGQTRSWSNGPGYASGGVNGNGSVNTQLPHLVQIGTSLVAVTNGNTARFYDLVYGTSAYRPRFFDYSVFAYLSGSNEYVLTDSTGEQFRFYDFTTGIPVNQRGQLKRYTDPNGNVTSGTAHTTDGKVTEVQRSNTTGGVTVIESYLYTYLTSGVNSGLLQNVTLRRQVNGDSWTTVRQVAYTYYDGTQSYGNVGDLMTATIEDASSNALDTSYYRYYTGESGGYQGGLKYVFNPQSYARLVQALGSTAPGNATDSQVFADANNYFEYDSAHRVTKEIAQGEGCSSCTGGLGTFTYAYTGSGNAPDYNSWVTKTVETLPDGTVNTVYTNAYAEVMLTATTTGSQTWLKFNKYDGSGRLILTANPSAVTGYNDTYADLLHYQSGTGYQYLSSTSGLIQLTNYATTTTATTTTAGDVAGYVQNHQVQQGQSGTAITTDSQQYFTQSDSNGNTIYPVASTTLYRNTDGTGAETTSYSYTFFSGTNQIQSLAVSLPVISSAQNGPGTADVSTTFFDIYGRPIWTKDADGFLNYTAYDQATGAVSKTITDVNTANTGDFMNLPSGWSTPTGGGLHLITQYVVDSLGRTTKLTDPLGNVSYTVYIDTNYEVLSYPGWNSSTNMPTGPTRVRREDRPGSYFEMLTMSATPHLTGGVPDGTEAISSLQTLSRSYTNAAGQFVSSDTYFNLTGVTYSTAANLGTEGTNYYRTRQSYDERGRPDRVQMPTGTINRTVYDGLRRVVSTWVGTNDTPGSGEWSPTNNTSPSNMVKTADNVYDNNTLGGGSLVGDGNLTQVIAHPGGSAPDRVGETYYDWRHRVVATKSGVQSSEDTTTHRPISYTTYDNLGEATQTQSYDGDTVAITFTNGVPNAPSASLLRAQTNTSYDDQSRVYQTQAYSVNSSTGAVSSSALTTNTWYNHRGQVIKTSQPGGLISKTAYDGAGRTTVSYTTDGGGDASWTDAGNVTGDNVLSQIETTYDADSNAILITDRERFHDETTTGALGNPTTAPKARVSFATSYYDLANRSTASVNVGTNGGTAYTRPSSSPTASDTVLVSSTTYNAAGWTDTVTDPRGIQMKTFYDNLGRKTKTVEAYDGGSITNNTNKTTEYTYDGPGHMLTLQADLVSSAYEQTKFIYGITTNSGSGLNSNDVLASMQYPDPSTGNPSSSQQETYTVDALGESLTKTDRNGNVHTLVYDILGRLISDQMTTLGSGIDGSVRRIDTAYDTQGNPYLITSYATTGTTTIGNQVQRAYNGLGQPITEYQSHSGAVNISTTPKVQYTYGEMAGGANNSRLTSIIYPGTGTAAKTVTYNYASGLDNSISRLTSLTDNNSITLESYSYLGLGTVVKRAHPQTGVDLTYIDPAGATGDAGDKYTGLDRFGRIIDQRWYNSITSTYTDRFQYSYDRDGNRLTRTNVISTSFNESYTYDNLNQLSSFARGTHTQSWTPDAAGNFSSVTTDGTAVNRTSNKLNEVTQVGSANLAFDANGNTTTDDNGKTLVYDAWNRLVGYKNGSTTLESFQYDGLNRRIVTNPGTATDLYYSSRWQVLEEQVGGASKIQYVWSPVYVDALVLRDRDATGSGTLSERLYVQQDANWNVTALVNTSGTVVERYDYDPFGKVTFLNATWGTLSSSAYAWTYLHQGGRYDVTIGLYYFRNRDYSPTLDRWLQVDPIQYRSGDDNLYRALKNNSIKLVDPIGLCELPPGGMLKNYGPSAGDQCSSWAAQEEKADKTWLSKIPPCPCALGSPANNPDSNVWFDPEVANQTYHPGAKTCIRSKPETKGGPGQQCCYDEYGDLLTHGASAGTPDKVAPVGFFGVLNHNVADVQSFNVCKAADMLDTYLKYRPPDNRNKCNKNP